MLTHLRICDFILIKEQEITLEPGLNVLTGETGSGKSILLQAIQVLLGAKPRGEVVRPGATEALIEGLFLLDKVPEIIRKELPDLLQGDELLISRSIGASGRSKVYINGRLSSLALLEELRPRLVNVCSQNQQVRLLDAKYHLETLDGYINKPEIFAAFQDSFDNYQQAKQQLNALEGKMSLQSSRQSEYSMIIEDLSDLDLKDGARDRLETELKRLQSGERLIEVCSRISQELAADAQLLSSLRSLQQSGTELTKIDAEFGKTFTQGLNEIKSLIADSDTSISRYQSKISLDDEKLEKIREDLAELARVMRKYKRSETELAALLAEAREFFVSTGSEDNLKQAKENVLALEKKAIEQATKISELRKQAGQKLSKEVVSGLAELNLKGARFDAVFEDKALSRSGIDQLEFMLSANKGLALKSLKEVASGGELSRILLVLKQVLREVTGVNVLVFDEVDTGISGSVARAVGEKLRELATYSQVLCITHLAQVASLADHHLVVNKSQDKLATTVVKSVIGDSRVDEIARMLSGHKVTEATRESARELLSSK